VSPQFFKKNRPATDHYLDEDILKPAKTSFVLLTILVALILNFIPLNASLHTLRPDFVALVILYWCINQPRQMGMFIAFCTGLMMDVHLAGILGHHAMTYCMIVYIASIFRRRISIFELIKQAPQIGLILVIMQSFQILITLLSGAHFPGWNFFLASLSGTVAWPLVSYYLSAPLRARDDPDSL